MKCFTSPDRPRDAFYGELIAQLTGAATVFHAHAHPGDWMSGKAQWSMRRADDVVYVSHSVARAAIVRGCTEDRISVVHNGIDLTHWEPSGSGSVVRAEFGISDHELVFGIVSRVVPSKGHEKLLVALSRLRDQLPPFRLLVVGDDDPAVLPSGFSQVKALKDQAYRLHIGDSVVFTGRRNDVRDLLSATDVFTMPSLDEGFGMAFVEAMATRIPVVALDVGGTSEVVEHGRTGLLSAADGAEALTRNIARLAHDPIARRQMGDAGRLRVEQRFTAAHMANAVSEVYRRVRRPHSRRVGCRRSHGGFG